MIFGYFEFIILVLLLGYNLFFQKSRSNIINHFFLIALLFGLILPAIAMKIEVEMSIRNGTPRDGWNFLWIVYVWEAITHAIIKA